MSLNYQLNKINNWEDVCLHTDGRVSKRTEILIFMSMSAGFNKITEKNFEEVHRRLEVLFDLGFYMLFDDADQPRAFDLDEVEAHIGLSTNASIMTKRKFETAVAKYKF